MSDDEDNNNKTTKGSNNKDSEIPTESSPGEAYMIFIDMNTLSNKLK